MKILRFVMPLKFTRKCLGKYVIPNSTGTCKMNTKRSPVPRPPLSEFHTSLACLPTYLRVVPTPPVFPLFTVLTSQAFVIHIRHTKISIFHAHLPNTYLSNIHAHGPRFSALFPNTPKIRLKQYGPWNMRHTQDQASLYRVLARVLWFLASGRSHVGYLAKCRGNPFVAKEVLNPVVCVTQVFVLCLFGGVVLIVGARYL